MSNRKDIPNVIAPPPLIFSSGLLIGILINWFYPLAFLPTTLAIIAGVLLIITGLGIVVTALGKMRRAETNVEPWKPTTAIIDDGIYAVSRNPIYVAMTLIYLGATFCFNSLWFFPLLILILIVMHFGVIRREEFYLERKFSGDYTDYKNRVRRWI